MTRRRFVVLALAIAVGIGGREAWWWHRFLGLACGYAAKVACSCVLLGGRDLASVEAEELGPFGSIDVTVDPARGTATAAAFGIWSRTARFRPGLGATLVQGDAVLVPAGLPPPPQPTASEWPDGEVVVAPMFDPRALTAAIDAGFAEPDAVRPLRTRAIVIVHRGRIVAERYAPGFGPATPQHGWSMSKSVVNALVGVMVRDGRLRLDAPAPIPEWQGRPADIMATTVDQLLRMESGLTFDERYAEPEADALRMLFGADDMAGYVAALGRDVPPDTRFAYSSGTTVLLARAIRTVVGDAANPSFARDALFAPLGMSTAVFELDAAGTAVGSSMVWASARDWARFGLLYLRDGVVGTTRLLPEGWVAYSTTPTPHASEGRFGAHFWLNAGDAAGARVWPTLPKDLFWAVGFQGQFVVMSPSRDAVIVRLGQTADPASFPIDRLVGDVLAALP